MQHRSHLDSRVLAGVAEASQGGKLFRVECSRATSDTANGASLYASCDFHAIGGVSGSFGVNLDPHPTFMGGVGGGLGTDLGCAVMMVYTW